MLKSRVAHRVRPSHSRRLVYQGYGEQQKHLHDRVPLKETAFHQIVSRAENENADQKRSFRPRCSPFNDQFP
jgi:hypothetical protein